MNNIGVTQGRLTSPKGRKNIQFMPTNDEISQEFRKGSFMSLDYIEWIFPANISNPFLGGFDSQETLKYLISNSGVSIRFICLDYLMDLDLEDKDLTFATQTINWIANTALNIDCKIIIIPIYNINMNILQIKDLLSLVLERFHIKVAFEFLDSNSFTGINFINDLNYGNKLNFRENTKIGCCFDIGNNCLVLGNVITPPQKNYEGIIKEMEKYNEYNMLHHIHIKEKDKQGNTVQLGKGIIGKKGWKEIFLFLKEIQYRGDFTLQVARGKEGDELEIVKKQIEFVKGFL